MFRLILSACLLRASMATGSVAGQCTAGAEGSCPDVTGLLQNRIDLDKQADAAEAKGVLDGDTAVAEDKEIVANDLRKDVAEDPAEDAAKEELDEEDVQRQHGDEKDVKEEDGAVEEAGWPRRSRKWSSKPVAPVASVAPTPCSETYPATDDEAACPDATPNKQCVKPRTAMPMPPTPEKAKCPCGEIACAKTWTCINEHFSSAADPTDCQKVKDARLENGRRPKRLAASQAQETCCTQLLRPCAQWQEDCYNNITKGWFPETKAPAKKGKGLLLHERSIHEAADTGIAAVNHSGQNGAASLDESLTEKCVE